MAYIEGLTHGTKLNATAWKLYEAEQLEKERKEAKGKSDESQMRLPFDPTRLLKMQSGSATPITAYGYSEGEAE